MLQRAQLTRSSGIGSGPGAAAPQPASSHTAIDAVSACHLVMMVLLIEALERTREHTLGTVIRDARPFVFQPAEQRTDGVIPNDCVQTMAARPRSTRTS